MRPGPGPLETIPGGPDLSPPMTCLKIMVAMLCQIQQALTGKYISSYLMYSVKITFLSRMLSEMGGGPRSSTGSREPSTDHQLQSKAYLSPSDTSIDESVKSAQAGKDVLEQYLKKSKANTLKSASSGLNTNVVPPSTSSIGDLMESVVGSPPPAMPPTGSSYFKSEYNSHLIRPQATPNSMSGFSPYYSSPKYSTPPLPSSESMLGSPIPGFTNQSKFYHPYDSQATGSQPHSLTSVSPTSGVIH